MKPRSLTKSDTRPARKRCQKCGAAGYYPTRARRCRQVVSRMGARFYCGGALDAAPIARAPRPKPSKLAQAEKAHARAWQAFNAATLREKRAIAATRRTWQAMKRTNAALVKAREAVAQVTTRSYFDDDTTTD